MTDFWNSIPVDKRGRAYIDLATYQWEKYQEILPLPVEEPEITINAPDYEEQEIEDINREMSEPPHGQEYIS